MQFGVFLLLQSPQLRPSDEVYRNAVEQAEHADRLGFDAVWLAEHHFSNYGYSPYPLLLAVHLAGRTRRLRLGTAVLVLPLHHPLQLAEEIAMADVLTGGRLEVGFGRGYQEYEFQRLQVPLDESRQRFNEGLEIVVRALTEEAFSHQGRYYHFPETAIFPRPLQRPHPLFWVAAQSPESVEATVARGYKVITGGSTSPVEAVQRNWEVLQRSLTRLGREGPEEFAVQRQVYVSDDEEDARAQVPHSRWHYRMVARLRGNTQRVERGFAHADPVEGEPSLERMYEEWLLFGTPEVVARKLRRYQEVTGLTYLNCVFAVGALEHEKVLRSMDLFAREVMPHFR